MKKKLINAWKPNPTVVKVDLTSPSSFVTQTVDTKCSVHDFAKQSATLFNIALNQMFPGMQFDVEWIVSLGIMDNPTGVYGRYVLVRRSEFDYGGQGQPPIQLTQEEYDELHKDRK